MELQLRTDLRTLPAAIEFNFEDLKRELELSLERYTGLVFTEEQLPEAKSDRAALNKLAEALESERKRVKKIYLEPYNAFESKIKEILVLVKAPADSIDSQIKEFERQKKDEKREQIKELFIKAFDDSALKATLESVWNEKWLNVTYSIAAVEKDLDGYKDKIEGDLKALSGIGGEYRAFVLAEYWRTLDLAAALKENARLERIAQESRREADKAAENVEKDDGERKAPAQAVAQQDELETGEVEIIDFRVYLTASQKRALRAFFVENNIKYGFVPKN